MIIDHTYFVGDLHLPMNTVNFSETEVSGVAHALQTVGQNSIQTYIDFYEIEFLRQLLSPQLAEALIEGLSEPVIKKRWVDLRDKLVYKYGSVSISPIANYVYYWIRRNGRTKTTIGGEVDLNFTQGNNSDDSDKLITAWNNMVELNERFMEWFIENIEDYEDDMDKEWFDEIRVYDDWFISGFGITTNYRIAKNRGNKYIFVRINSFGLW